MPTVHPQVQKARDLMPLIAAASDENDEIRELTKPVVKALIDGGFFTMLKTKSIGGMELKPSIFAQVTEALANADGSTGGWCVKATVARPQAHISIRLLPRRFLAGRTGSSLGDLRVHHTRPHQWKAGTASLENGAS